jgi:hypothetical protein
MAKWVRKKKAISFMLFLSVFILQSRSALAEDISLRCHVNSTAVINNVKSVTNSVELISIRNNYGYMIDESPIQMKFSVRSTNEYFFLKNVNKSHSPDAIRISRVTGQYFAQLNGGNLIVTWTGRCERVQFERKF